MTQEKKVFLVSALGIVLVSIFFVFSYFKLKTMGYLSFSDGAKFALVAKNLIEGGGYGSDFTFYSGNLFAVDFSKPFIASGIPFLVPVILSLFFRVLGVSDFSVIIFSATFYIFLILATYLLAKRIFGNMTGILSALAIASDVDFLNYATSGASEMVYTFLALASLLLIFENKKWSDILFFPSLLLLYLTRPQGIVFILAFLFVWLMYKFSLKKALTYFLGFLIGIFVLDKLILYPLSFRYPVYPIVTRGIQALFQYSPAAAVSDALRGGVGNYVGWKEIFTKTFYNIYNFYKLLPSIASPYMWGFFALGLFFWGGDKKRNTFKVAVVLAVSGTFMLTAITIPFYRYLHPVTPFVYIVAIATIGEIVSKFEYGRSGIYVTSFLVFLFVVGQSLGMIFLDSRFERRDKNLSKPPLHVVLSRILKDNTDPRAIVVTNLDTWGSWYGARRTVWFPLSPKQLVDLTTGQIPFDAIYLADYKIDDENYYMGGDWRKIFLNPDDSKKWMCDGCSEIKKNFELKGVYYVKRTDDYENQNSTSMLLVKK